MPTIIQTVLGATQFDGLTVTTGRYVWDDMGDFTKIRPVLMSVSFFCLAVVATMELRLVQGTVPTAIAVLARDTTGNRDSMDYPCRRRVMQTNEPTPVFWRLEFFTTGKTADGTLQIDWEMMPTGTW